MYFNSIKVQLDHVLTSSSKCVPVFQFHKGTIRSGIAESAPSADTSFQFHKGTIRSTYEKH